MRLLWTLTLIFHFHQCIALKDMPSSVFARFPPFRFLDRFGLCLDRKGGAYCSANVHLVTDSPNELYDIMKNYTYSAQRHLDYLNPHYGYCITGTRCKKFYKGDSDEELVEAMGACINETLQKEYGLSARINYTMCYRHGESKHPVTTADQAVSAVFLTLVALAALGTGYDLFATNRDPNSYLMCFSIPANWAKLKAPWPQDKMIARLIGINGIRTITTLLVVLFHTGATLLHTIENPFDFEETMETAFYHFLGNMNTCNQTFFFLSGLFLTYTMQIAKERTVLTWTYLPKAIFLRWLRLSVVPIVGLMYAVTWQKHTQHGPFWHELLNVEAEACHKEWPAYLLLYKNYVYGSNCHIPYWSSQVDFHLHIIGATILILSPSEWIRNAALWVLFAVGLVLPGIETYARDLGGICPYDGKSMQHLVNYVQQPSFNYLHLRTHNNIPVFVMGMAFGLALYKWQKNPVVDTAKYKKYTCWYWMLLPVFLILLYIPSVLVMKEGDPAALYVRVLFAVAIKPIWGVAIALLIYGMIYEVEKVPVYRRVLEWPGWLPLVPLSYSIYNVHLTLRRLLNVTSTQLTYSSNFHYMDNAVGLMGMSIVFATILWLLVEAPCNNLVRKLFQKQSIIQVDNTPKKTE